MVKIGPCWCFQGAKFATGGQQKREETTGRGYGRRWRGGDTRLDKKTLRAYHLPTLLPDKCYFARGKTCSGSVVDTHVSMVPGVHWVPSMNRERDGLGPITATLPAWERQR